MAVGRFCFVPTNQLHQNALACYFHHDRRHGHLVHHGHPLDQISHHYPFHRLFYCSPCIVLVRQEVLPKRGHTGQGGRREPPLKNTAGHSGDNELLPLIASISIIACSCGCVQRKSNKKVFWPSLDPSIRQASSSSSHHYGWKNTEKRGKIVCIFVFLWETPLYCQKYRIVEKLFQPT